MPDSKTDDNKERRLQGLGVAPGVAIGTAYIHAAGPLHVPEASVDDDDIGDEVLRFQKAVEATRRQLTRLKSKTSQLSETAAREMLALLNAHIQMLTDSRLLRGAEARMVQDKINAEAALSREVEAIVETFAAIDDPYIAARAADVRDVAERVLRQLTKTADKAWANVPEDSVVIAAEMGPAETAALDPDIVAGLATVLGGAEGHTAIMARSLGLPAVLGVDDLLDGVHSGDGVIIDGDNGVVIIHPSKATLQTYETRAAQLEKEKARWKRNVGLPNETKDGTAIVLQANIEFPRDVPVVFERGGGGVGLLRTEFMFMQAETMPDEDEQTEVLRGIVKAMQDKPITIRTIDIGAEKPARSLAKYIPDCANPALGMRAIRMGLKHPRILETQLAAICRAAAYGDVRILLPMVAHVHEVNEARKMLRAVYKRLQRRGEKLPDTIPPLGVMIEVPAAAVAADALALVSDFFALGTNDLTMYTLAVDRSDDSVAHLYSALHPAVLRLIQFTVEAALRARIPVSVCGEIAGDPRYTALLLGLGVRELSMSPRSIPRIKQRLRGIDLIAATNRAQAILDQPDQERVTAMVDDFNQAD